MDTSLFFKPEEVTGRPRLTVDETRFWGSNEDGTLPILFDRNRKPGGLYMHGWLCIGPGYLQELPWRVRLARWLLLKQAAMPDRKRVEMNGIFDENHIPYNKPNTL